MWGMEKKNKKKKKEKTCREWEKKNLWGKP